MKIWKIVYNEIERGKIGEVDPLRVDPAIVACAGDGLDAVRGPRSCELPDEEETYEWEVVGIEVVSIELVTTVDYIDPGLRLRATA